MNMDNHEQTRRPIIFNYKTLVGILISALGLYLGFRKFDAREFWISLQQTDILIFIGAMLLMVLTVVLRAWRWKYLILPLQDVPYKQLFGTEMVGYFGNNVFPLRLGEILRAYSLNRITQISTISVFGTIVIERFFDVIVFIIVLILAAILFPSLPVYVKYAGIGTAIGAALLLIFYYISRYRNWVVKDFIKKRLLHRSSRRLRPLQHFARGLLTLRDTPYRWKIFIQSLLVWLLAIFIYWVVGLAFGLVFSAREVLLIFFVTSAIISVPSAPGYVGTYHAGAIGVLVFLGYELSAAQVIAVILHAVGFISLTFIGLIYFLKYHIRLDAASWEEARQVTEKN